MTCYCSDYQSSGLPCPPGKCPNAPKPDESEKVPESQSPAVPGAKAPTSVIPVLVRDETGQPSHLIITLPLPGKPWHDEALDLMVQALHLYGVGESDERTINLVRDLTNELRGELQRIHNMLQRDASRDGHRITGLVLRGDRYLMRLHESTEPKPRWAHGVPSDIMFDEEKGIRFDSIEGYWGSLNIQQAQALARRINETWPESKG